MGGIYSNTTGNYSKTTNPPPPPPPVASGGREIIPSGAYTCKFTDYSLSYGSGTGNYLISKETAYSVIINTESMLRLRGCLLFDGYHYKIDEYLKAIDKIQELMKSGMITNYQSEGINVMDMAMKRLQLEFEGILTCPTNKIKNHMHSCEISTAYSSSVSSSSYELHDTDSIAHGELSSIQQVIHLRNIIARLKSCTGFLDDCIQLHRISRKSVVDWQHWISKSVLKKRLKIFDAMLEDIFGTRSTWLVPDLQFQGQLDKFMFEELIPAYESFLVKYRSHVESGKDPEKYIKYLPEDLKDELDGKRKVFSTIK